MTLNVKSLFLFLCILMVTPLPLLRAQQTAHIPGDFADPSVIAAGGKYYSIGTSSEWAPHFPIYSSDDLDEWTQEGFLFEKAPEWTGSSFWAPEYFYHRGLYYVYYSAKRKADGVSCIGVATSKYPDRGFV
ncbi:MAG: glycoside hydrolase family 43 protein, partial [Sphingobacterium sp.]